MYSHPSNSSPGKPTSFLKLCMNRFYQFPGGGGGKSIASPGSKGEGRLGEVVAEELGLRFWTGRREDGEGERIDDGRATLRMMPANVVGRVLLHNCKNGLFQDSYRLSA